MLLVSRGFTPEQVETEFSMTDLEQFMAALPAIQQLTTPYGGIL